MNCWWKPQRSRCSKHSFRGSDWVLTSQLTPELLFSALLSQGSRRKLTETQLFCETSGSTFASFAGVTLGTGVGFWGSLLFLLGSGLSVWSFSSTAECKQSCRCNFFSKYSSKAAMTSVFPPSLFLLLNPPCWRTLLHLYTFILFY